MNKQIPIKFLSLLISFCICLSSKAIAYDVMYNTQTHKYHKLSCSWAKKCTKNCIKIKKEHAKQKGGVPCKVCGG